MNPLGQLILARLREFFREPSALFWTYGFPTLLTLALGMAFQNPDPKQVVVAVWPGPDQQRRIDALQADPGIRVEALSEEETRRRFLGARVTMAVSGTRDLVLTYDPRDPEAPATRCRVLQHLREASLEPLLPVQDAPIEAPGARYIDFLVPGLIGMNILSGSMWGIGYALVEARKRKLLKRLAATPMRRGDFLVSFFLARLLFLGTEVAVILAFAMAVFGLEVQGSWAALVLLAATGAMAFGGLGLLAASRTRSTETVAGLMNLIMLPMFVLSGVFFSASRFPDFLQPVIGVLPLTLLNDGLRAVINEGAGLGSVAGPLVALAAGGWIASVVALRIFRWF